MTPVSDVERGMRSKRRIGCGVLLVVFVTGLLLLALVVYLVFLRTNPNPPLAPWIPAQADVAAKLTLDFSPQALGGLTQILLQAEGSLTEQERELLLKHLDELVRLALHKQILVVATVESETLEPRWAAVANVRRGEQLLVPLSKRLLGDEVRWTREKHGEQEIQRLQISNYGIEGILSGSQLIVSNHPDWLALVVGQPAIPGESPLGRATRGEAPFRIAVNDENGELREILREFSELPSDPDIAAASESALRILEDAGGNADLDLWLKVESGRAVFRPANGANLRPATLDEVSREIQETLTLLSGMERVTFARRMVDENGKNVLEVNVPALGFLLSQSFQ